MIIITSIGLVKAEELPEITSDIEIRYKWYREIVSSEGEYVPLKDVKEEDTIDENNIKYGALRGIYNIENCSLPSEYYLIEEKYVREYKRVYNASYVLIENATYSDNIKIYYDNKLIDFTIISNEDNKVKINLKKEYLCDKLMFLIDSDTNYTITLYRDSAFEKEIISKNIENEKISFPDKTWITENTKFYTQIATNKFTESDLMILKSETINCSYREKYVYKYEITKEYYDDNYHVNVDGYIKDVNDYKIFYTGKPITNTVEIITEKIVKEPQIEYVYIEKENNIQENDSSQEKECSPETITKIETQVKKEIVEKEIYKIPKKIYIIIFILIIVIVLLAIKLYKKYVV